MSNNQVTQSGEAMVVYGISGDSRDYYRVWDGDWSQGGLITPPALETLTPRWMTLGADHTSDRIALGVSTAGNGSNSDTWLGVWTGSMWETPVSATTTQVDNLNYPNVAVAFESFSGQALAVYADDTTHYRTLKNE